ncbi:hypothetical protein JTE90_015626 [Oedothorax gibbosus]|uniref:Sex combs reduced n=1 Tax=Oedothorax gibbosus TaxID=931172 RepID=A0AAV6UVC1_9ARAC|nr:hypothetical protein JTE90_015626 [Oedothorax gibbosus]
MSSYQFVNSLTSCYGQRSQDSSSQDYYTPQVQTGYGGCYSGPGSPVTQQYGPQQPYPPQHHLQQNGASTDNAAQHHFNSCSQTSTAPRMSPRAPTPSVTPVPSCKYAEPSPQDLSTSASQQPPAGAGSPADVSRTSPGPRHSSPSSQQGSSPQQAGDSAASPQQASAPGQQKAGYPSNPPQIYPWMRKVHVGQSK